MDNVLYLTAEEKKLFGVLGKPLQEGWDIKDEAQGAKDTNDARQIRMELLRLESPALEVLSKKIGEVKSAKDFEKLVVETDLSMLSESDLIELFFVLGPDGVSSIISSMLRTVRVDEDIERISWLSAIRHTLVKASLAHPIR